MAQNGAFSALKEGTVLITTGPIQQNAESVEQLNKLVASTKALKRAGYVVEKLTDTELDQKRRCTRCGVRVAKPPRIRHHNTEVAENKPPKTQDSDSQAQENPNHRGTDVAATKPLECRFHTGKVVYKVWTCCRKHVSKDPCTIKKDHDVRDDQGGANERRWQFHVTAPEMKPNHRAAVAIDCEMGTAFDGDSELIRLTVVDYFTGKALIDSLVYPDVPMMHFNTRWSGVTKGDMERARREHKCILGKAAARKAIFRYVGPSTIVIGHGAQNDLCSLRWIHHRVVDFFLIESSRRKEAELRAERERRKKEEEEAKWDEPKGVAERGGTPEDPELNEKGGAKLYDKDGAEPNEVIKAKEVNKPKEGDKATERKPGNKQPRRKNNPDGMSLKALTMKHLGRAIQVGTKGHDSLEDALAARDLVHAYITDPGRFTSEVEASASEAA
ncbi:hypothetical protein F5144DRAFT_615214 [Chaetomium tenue]|uniref:Uncharacterized protein n=1 Tax=Chaetomium tenue TaxID=1854479 RepID=A0ACB7NZ93_9PEZI|nr:hypothetical protein F5144DRAFT_615214 [Chaetomium globosum]